MSSTNANMVALKVSEAIRKPEIVNLGKIIRESGYSYQTSLKPKLVTTTKTYQKAMKPLVEGLSEEINRIKEELANKDLTKERHKDLVDSFDKLVKNYQLLSGGATERVINVEISEAIAKKNE